jgi:hypothetical protein
MLVFWNLASEAEGDGEIFGRVSKSDGRAGTSMAKGVSGGGGAEAIGRLGGAIAVAVEHDAEAKIGDLAEGHIFFALSPAMRKILDESRRKDSRSSFRIGALG